MGFFLEKPGIEPATPGLQGIALIHYTTGASQGSSKSAHAWISIILCMLNTYIITTTKMKLVYSSKTVRPHGGATLMYTLFVLIYRLYRYKSDIS